jgi:hypothetical protein
VGQVVDIAEDDDGSEAGRQVVEGPSQPGAQIARVGPQLRVVIGARIGDGSVVVEDVVPMP